MVLKTSTTGLTSAAAIDDQWLEIEDRLSAMEGGGLIKDEIVGIAQDPVDHSLSFDLGPTKGPFGPFRFPAAPYKRMGDWVPGGHYQPWDLVSVGGAKYVCNVDHIAGSVFSVDLSLLKWELHAEKGRDAYLFRGIWTTAAGWTQGSVTTAYVAGDAVYYNGILWILYATPTTTHTAPGTEAGPGVTASPWQVLAANYPFGSQHVKDATENQRLNVIIAELRTEISNLKNRVTTLETP